MAKPEINDVIEHSEPTFERVVTGKVVQLLDNQFVYEVHKYLQIKQAQECVYIMILMNHGKKFKE